MKRPPFACSEPGQAPVLLLRAGAAIQLGLLVLGALWRALCAKGRQGERQLEANARRFGFIHRYAWEPWH
jgi:hypothetical protein